MAGLPLASVPSLQKRVDRLPQEGFDHIDFIGGDRDGRRPIVGNVPDARIMRMRVLRRKAFQRFSAPSDAGIRSFGR
ncbi:hypothetical protein V5F41_23390 [Xanthobacter autotrophicus]|uniref:hypothetical protein n=1 Tax=Xanthobacter autotrophicus TaxID=280 RepID=UPI003726B867